MRSMSGGVRRVLSVAAILAIALHTVAWGVVGTMAAGSAVDPFSVICHSGPQAAAPADQTPGTPPSSPASACDHCNLCSATPTPPSALDTVLAGILTPVKLLHVVPQAPVIARDAVASSPKLSQGPPQLT